MDLRTPEQTFDHERLTVRCWPKCAAQGTCGLET
jgi:hypothetical protein